MPFSKDDVFTGLAEVGMALANKHRLQIVSLLSHGPKTVEQLVDAIDQSKATTSAHLKTLRTSGLVTPRKEGKYVWYSLSDQAAETLWLSLRTVGEKLQPGLESKIKAWDAQDHLLSSMTELELKAAIDNRKCLLLDLRPVPEYAKAHIPSAVSVPLVELDQKLSSLASRRPILAYCRGPYCQAARQGISRIAEVFPTARRLKFSVPEWRAAGLSTSQSDN